MKKENFKVQAVKSITNLLSLHVMIVHEDGEDFVYSRYCDNEGKLGKMTKSYVHYSRKDAPYFIKDNKRCYLDEFMKI